MTYDPNIHHRRSLRLPGYDYSQSGSYFVTICAAQRQCLFGEIIDGQMVLNQSGMVVADEWQKSALIRWEIKYIRTNSKKYSYLDPSTILRYPEI